MARIVDLSVIQQEPLIFKMPEGSEVKEFNIAGEVSTSFVMKMNKLYDDMNRENLDDMERIKIMKQIVVEILKQDKENASKVNMKFIDDNLDDLRYLQVIVQAMMEHISDIQSNENLNSPKSE